MVSIMAKTQAQAIQETTAAAALVKSTADSAAVSLNIQYIQRDIMEMKQSLKDMAGNFATHTELNDHIQSDINLHAMERATNLDHETRMRSLEKTSTQTITWGAAGVMAVGIVQFILIQYFK